MSALRRAQTKSAHVQYAAIAPSNALNAARSPAWIVISSNTVIRAMKESALIACTKYVRHVACGNATIVGTPRMSAQNVGIGIAVPTWSVRSIRSVENAESEGLLNEQQQG